MWCIGGFGLSKCNLPRTTNCKMSNCLDTNYKSTSGSIVKATSLLELKWSLCHLRGALLCIFKENNAEWSCDDFTSVLSFQLKLKSYHAKSAETSHQASTMESSHAKAVRLVHVLSLFSIITINRPLLGPFPRVPSTCLTKSIVNRYLPLTKLQY